MPVQAHKALHKSIPSGHARHRFLPVPSAKALSGRVFVAGGCLLLLLFPVGLLWALGSIDFCLCRLQKPCCRACKLLKDKPFWRRIFRKIQACRLVAAGQAIHGIIRGVYRRSKQI
mgnify:CR=1 FL=1